MSDRVELNENLDKNLDPQTPTSEILDPITESSQHQMPKEIKPSGDENQLTKLEQQSGIAEELNSTTKEELNEIPHLQSTNSKDDKAENEIGNSQKLEDFTNDVLMEAEEKWVDIERKGSKIKFGGIELEQKEKDLLLEILLTNAVRQTFFFK